MTMNAAEGSEAEGTEEKGEDVSKLKTRQKHRTWDLRAAHLSEVYETQSLDLCLETDTFWLYF